MTAKELIEKLTQLDPDTRIFGHGYEGGYYEVQSISGEHEFCLNINDESYYGPHEKASEVYKDKNSVEYYKWKGVDPDECKRVRGVVI